jgi:predicted nuclease of predicted toxin-antitoxin system
MKFLLDENFPKAAAELLKGLGHDSHDPRGTELEGSEDSVLVEEARRLDAVILTQQTVTSFTRSGISIPNTQV